MLQLIRNKHSILARQRQESGQHLHTQIFAGSICPPTITPLDPHSGVDSVVLTNMALLLDIIYVELQHTGTGLHNTSRGEIMNHLENNGKASDNPIFRALVDELGRRTAC